MKICQNPELVYNSGTDELPSRQYCQTYSDRGGPFQNILSINKFSKSLRGWASACLMTRKLYQFNIS